MKSNLILIFFFITSLSFAQSKPFKATPAQTAALKKQAGECADALMKQDYKKMAYYTYPPIIKAMGGENKMVEKLSATMGQMQNNGVSFKSVTIGDVKDITESKGDLYSLVQDILQLSINGTVVTKSSYLLAYSHDKGTRWYFVDIAQLRTQNVIKLFPTYPPALVLPEMQKPMMGGN